MNITHSRIKEQNKDREVFIPELVSRFLKSRGYLNKEDQIQFLNPLLKNIKDPFKLLNMQTAIERLIRALSNGESLGLYCDYDLDGSSSAAILEKGLTELGFNVELIYQPRRLTEGYGFHKSAVDKFKDLGISLIITADVGITSYESVKYASEQGLDVIVTDHHLPDDSLPKAVAVINPNQKDCESGLGHLCGAGVAFYLVYAFAKTQKRLGLLPQSFNLEELLDYLVIGTITDMVPLVEENRALVKRGLSQFTKTLKPGLKAIKVKEGLIGKSITSSDIGFKIAPKLNSLSRLDTDLRPTDILMEKSKEQATQLVEQAYLFDEKRKEALEDGLELALNECHKEDFCFYVSSKIHPGVMGLVATKLVNQYNLPAFVASKLSTGMVVGSARLPRHSGLSLKEVMEECSSLLQYGGHAQAAGFELESYKIDDFKKEVYDFIKSHQATKKESVFIDQEFDCEVLLSELNRSFIPWLNQLEPFGTGFEAPRFKVSKVKIKELRLLKDIHYKLIISDSRGFIAEALWFFPPKEHEVLEFLEGDAYKNCMMNFYVTPQINFFRNNESLQLLVNELEICL